MLRKMFSAILCLLLTTSIALAQSKQVSGRVISADDGLPVIGASVIAAGTSTGTVTDLDGYFSMEIPSSVKFLKISYVGMRTVEATAKPNMIINLQTDQEELDEVMVVAYGTARKSSFTGSASVLGAKTIEKRALTNATSAIEGNTPGVQVVTASGQPGSAPSLRIRGFGSVNASNAPLYVLDGAIYNGNIADINPMDIESMTILKDAASTSLYGSSAGNGVVLITTKKGTSKKANVRLTINQGWSNRSYKDYAKASISDYYPMQWQMMKNSLVTAGESEADAAQYATENIVPELEYNAYLGIDDNALVLTDGLLNPNANILKWGNDLGWEDAAFQTGYRQEYTLSYDTKSDISDTYASVSYLDDKGYVLKTDFERYSARLNYNIYPAKWFKAGLNIGLARVSSNYSTANADDTNAYSNIVRFVRSMAPIYPIHKHNMTTGAYLDKDGNPTIDPSQYVYDYDGPRLSSPGRHAIAETKWNDRKLQRNSQSINTYITITPIKGLSINANYALNSYEYRSSEYENPLVGDGTAGPGRLDKRSNQSVTQSFNQLVSYNIEANDNNFDFLLGHESYQFKYEYLRGFKSKEILSGMYEFGNFVNIDDVGSYTNNYRKEGYFARVNYDYNDKYYATGSYRYDGSSRFSSSNRWGSFWSVGASWRISQENFMQDVNWVNNLKLRASYGETGNDDVSGYYPYQTTYELGYNNSTEAGAYFTDIANKDLKWETQISTDVAVEFGLWDRIYGSIEVFQKSSKDLLFDVSTPSSAGVSSIIKNIGKIKNNGFEIDLNATVLERNDWFMSLGVNTTFVKNELVTLPETMRENGYINGSKKWEEGRSIYDFWLRQWYGVNPENGDGLFYLDTEEYNAADETLSDDVAETVTTIDGVQLTNNSDYAAFAYSGTSTPTVYGGFNFNLSWKNIDLSATFSYQLGGKLLDYNYADIMSTSGYGEAMGEDLIRAWKNPGDITDVPRLDANADFNSSVGTGISTRWLTSSNFLNLRALSLGYNLPKQLIAKAHISNARISLTGENIFMIKAYQGLNPTQTYSGISSNTYMPTRNYTISLNVAF